MGRTKTVAPEAIETPALDDQALLQVQNLAGSIVAEGSEERDLANQLLGQVQMANAFGKWTTVVYLSKLQQVRESKLYRALPAKNVLDEHGREIADCRLNTWDGYCRALGLSANKVEEDLRNLNVFGQDALESMSRMGIGYRELRQYRRLPADQQSELIEVAKTGDKEAFVDLAEEIIAKHAREKAELEKRTENLQADYDAQGQVLADTSAKLQSTKTELEKSRRLLQTQPLDKKEQGLRLEVVAVTTSAESDIVVNLSTGFNQLLEMDNGADPRPFMAAQLRQLEIAIARLRTEYDLEDVDADGGADWLQVTLPGTPAQAEG